MSSLLKSFDLTFLARVIANPAEQDEAISPLPKLPLRGKHLGQCFQDTVGSGIIDFPQHFD